MSLKSLFNFESTQELSSTTLETIMNSIPSGIIAIEKAHEKIVYVNKRFIEITGFNPIGLSLREFTLNMTKLYKLDSTPFLYEQLPLTNALFCGKITRNQEMIIYKADKSKLIALVNAKPVTDNGEITGAIAIFEDITERKKAEEALRISEEKFSTAFKNSPIAVTITRLNDGKIIDGNDSVTDVLGYNPKEAIGKTTLQLGLWANPDDRKEFAKTLITKGSIKNQEFVLVRKDGAQIIVNLSASIIYVQNEPCFISSFIDVTERKRAEETLKQFQIKIQEYANNLERLVEERTKKIKENEQSYRELYESFDEAFIAIDWELNIIHWNKAAERITTVPTKDALGKKIYEIMPEMTSIDVTSYLEALQKRRPTRFMMNVKSRVTGKTSIFEISTYPSTQGITIIVEDKTQEEETKRLSTIGQVAGMVGHDIRNPLQAIISDVYLLKQNLTSMPEMPTKNEVSESLIGIEQNVEYISKIVADLQDYVKPFIPNLRETNIELVLDDVLVKRAIPKNIEISRVIQAEARNLISDPDLLKRIFANLINNAVQAMPQGGKLSIQAIREETDIILTVEDTGTGIPDEVKPKLFQPLFTTKAKGQGFGLAAVKRMTEALNGKITFESEIGKGTKFIINLPAQQ